MLRDHAMLHTQPRGVLRAYRPHLYAPPAAAAARAQMERAWPAVLDAVVALVGTDVWLEQREHAVSAEGSAAMDGSEGIIQTVVARPDKEDVEVLMGLCVHRLAEENAAAATRGSTVPSQGQPPSWRVMADGAACGCGPGLARPRAGQRVGSPRRASGSFGSQEGLDPDGPMQCLAALKNLLAPRYLTPAAIPPTELLAIFSLLEGTAACPRGKTLSLVACACTVAPQLARLGIHPASRLARAQNRWPRRTRRSACGRRWRSWPRT
jgi:hypothetical protein